MSPIKKNKSISTKQLLNHSVAETSHYINKCWSIEIAWLLTWAGEVSWYAVDEQFGLIGKCIHDVSAGIRRIQAQGNICSFEGSYESRSDLTDYEALVLPLSLRSWMASITREGISMKQRKVMSLKEWIFKKSILIKTRDVFNVYSRCGHEKGWDGDFTTNASSPKW